MANDTMRKFGYPQTLIREYEHWVVLVRPAQITLGSLVLAAKSDAPAFGMLPSEAHAELSRVTREIEASLGNAVNYDRINYLMLMMVDPHVHFHVIPRYEGKRGTEGIVVVDQGWPGPPDLKSALPMEGLDLAQLSKWLSDCWLTLN